MRHTITHRVYTNLVLKKKVNQENASYEVCEVTLIATSWPHLATYVAQVATLETPLQDFLARLPSETPQQDSLARLPRKTPSQDSLARLPSKTS